MIGDVYQCLERHRILPILTIQDASTAAPIGLALKRGGLPVAEVTLRTPESERALSILASDPELLVGAGTVLTVEHVHRAMDAGARFVVSPGLCPEVVQAAQEQNLVVLPGVATATEIMSAVQLGVAVVKLFPAATLGGASAVRALSAPFPGLRFVPTGGIGPGQLGEYLEQPAVLAVGGSWLATPKLVGERNWPEITALTAAACSLAGRAAIEEPSR